MEKGSHYSVEQLAKRRLMHPSEESNRKRSQTLKARGDMGNWLKGKPLSYEHKKKISLATKGKPHTEEHSKNISLALIGKSRPCAVGNNYNSEWIKNNNPMNNEVSRKKISEKAKERWSNPEFKQMVVSKCAKNMRIRPTKPEQELNDLLGKFFPNQWKYVGAGEFIIGGCIPDFIHVNRKLIIEVYGSYWHRHEIDDNGGARIKMWKGLGYDCLIIWNYEIEVEVLVERITEFLFRRVS